RCPLVSGGVRSLTAGPAICGWIPWVRPCRSAKPTCCQCWKPCWRSSPFAFWASIPIMAASSLIALTVSLEQAKEMIEGLRQTLTRDIRHGPPKAIADTPLKLRGKYKCVPTTSDEFIRRKAEELGLEHDAKRL